MTMNKDEAAIRARSHDVEFYNTEFFETGPASWAYTGDISLPSGHLQFGFDFSKDDDGEYDVNRGDSGIISDRPDLDEAFCKAFAKALIRDLMDDEKAVVAGVE